MSNSAPILERRAFAKGKQIVKEGEDAFTAFIVQSGKVRVYSEKNGQKIEFSVLEAGQIFGEMSLIHDGKRTASVEAMEDCTLVVITRDMFQNKLQKSDPTIKAIVEMLSDRVVKANQEVMKSKGVNINNFIALLNQLFRDLLDAMPEGDKRAFRDEAFPVMRQMTEVIEKYRDKLE